MVDRKELTKNESGQKEWSMVLIFAIVFMFIVYMRCTPSDEDTGILHMVLVGPIITILLGGYLFAYSGKGTNGTVRVIFIILIILSLILLAGFAYLIALGSAFKN
ncbi:hypothetical protein [Pedobacter caeni]|uniref:Uncharacterized protein n=1 Tax=Pedobacter caeni TaxID=288992 RepID=A0A1M5JJB1_9SPHI|nr:hypothetical protein [Pedobacter caeni]SHG40133.1 hypothetical protein SAMN04488522_105362 [Pedobacter caeni]